MIHFKKLFEATVSVMVQSDGMTLELEVELEASFETSNLKKERSIPLFIQKLEH